MVFGYDVLCCWLEDLVVWFVGYVVELLLECCGEWLCFCFVDGCDGGMMC